MDDKRKILRIPVRGGFIEGDHETGEDAYNFISRINKDYSGFILVDLDGMEKRSPDMELLQDCSEDFYVLAETGVRTLGDAIDTAMTSVDGVICNPDMLEDGLDEIVGILENAYLLISSSEKDLSNYIGYWPESVIEKLAGVVLQGSSWSLEDIKRASSLFGEVFLAPEIEGFPEEHPENVRFVVEYNKHNKEPTGEE